MMRFSYVAPASALIAVGLLVPSPATAAAQDGSIDGATAGETACRALLANVDEQCRGLEGKVATAAQLDAEPMLAWCARGKVTGGCKELATTLEAELAGLVDRAPSPATLQPLDAEVARAQQADRQSATNKQGTVAATEPVSSVQPITLAGGSLSIAGTRVGTQGVATVTVNPLALGRPDSPLPGRLFDLSVTAPFNLDGSANPIRFVGVRARVNATAPWSTERLRAALDGYYKAAGAFGDTLEVLLRGAGDVKSCASSILKTHAVAASACGQTLDQANLTRLRETSVKAVQDGQREADRYYFGLDLRADFGDPTGDVVVGDKGTRVQGGLAGGIRIPNGKYWDIELRGHVAGDYFRSKDSINGVRIDPVFSVDWGAAALISGHATGETDKQRLAFGVGVVGRHAASSAATDVVPTNFVDLRLMAVVPTTSGSDVGLAVMIPLDDSATPRGSIVSVSTDLGLLDGTSPRSTGQP